MDKNDTFISGAEMISNVFRNISCGEVEQSDKVVRAWQTTVSKISGNGQQLADHSRVIDLKNKILLVETDHPGWSQMLQMHKKFILIGLNRLSGDVRIESLAFRVKGSDARLSDVAEIDKITQRASQEYKDKMDAEQKALEAQGFVNRNTEQREKGGLPPELSAIFDRLKKSSRS